MTRLTKFAIGAAGALVLAAAEISPLRAIAPRAGGWASSQEDGPGRPDIHAAVDGETHPPDGHHHATTA